MSTRSFCISSAPTSRERRGLGIDDEGRAIYSFIDGFTPPHNGYRLDENAVRAGAQLVRQVHDLTEGTGFAAGSEVACHPNLSQPNLVHPAVYDDWDAAPMLRVAVDAYGWSGGGLVDAMLATVRRFQRIVAGDPGTEAWAANELAELERNAPAFRAALGE